MEEKGVIGRGVFVVVDGLDGIGKGEIERALIDYEQRSGRTTFDSVSWSRAHKDGLPEIQNFWNPPEVYYNTVISAEPTYFGIGHAIRFEIISRNARDYSAETEIQAYSLDRLVSMKKVVIPAIQNNLRVIQSRCVASTLTYQSLRAEEEGQNSKEVRGRILSHEGNKLQLQWAPNLLIIPTIADVNTVISRIKGRKDNMKDDRAIFETLKFQSKLKPLYESSWLRDIFENHGTKVAYIDAGISVDSSRNQAVDIYRSFVESGSIPEKYSNLENLFGKPAEVFRDGFYQGE